MSRIVSSNYKIQRLSGSLHFGESAIIVLLEVKVISQIMKFVNIPSKMKYTTKSLGFENWIVRVLGKLPKSSKFFTK